MEAVIDPSDPGGVADVDLIADIISASVMESAGRRQERKDEQDRLRDQAKGARDAIRFVDSGYERRVPDQSGVRNARKAFLLRLADLVASPSIEGLTEARWAMRKLVWERLAVSNKRTKDDIDSHYSSPVGLVVLAELRTDLYRACLAHKKKGAKTSPDNLDEIERLKSEVAELERKLGMPGLLKASLQSVASIADASVRQGRRVEDDEISKVAAMHMRRRAIEVAIVRSRGTHEALEDALLAGYGSWKIELDMDEYNKVKADFAKPPKPLNPKYFCARGSENLYFAMKREKPLVVKDGEGKKKKKGKRKASQQGGQGQKGGRK